MGETGKTGGSRGSGSWSREPEDLSKHWALEQCESIEFEGVQRPYLGKTALLAELGRGGMGIVYFGINPRLNTEVAIKVLPIRIQRENEESVERFVREARLAAQLQSPHLVRVLDVDKDEKSGAHYIVMEYVRGKSAREWMDEFKLEKGASEKDALKVVMAATKGLKAAHMDGILHRDVKPHNILIPANDAGKLQLKHAKLADLGLARHESTEDEITSTQVGMGTPGYTSAEQATDARSATKRSDVFGIGATLFALLTKKRPYQGKNSVDIVINTMKGKYKRIREVRPDISKGTAALLGKCLSPEPEDRFADAAALLQALRVCYRSLTQPAQAGPSAVEQAVIKLVTRKERGKRVADARRAGTRRTPGRPLAPMRRRRQSSNSGIVVGFIVVGLMAAAYMLITGSGGNSDDGLYIDSTPTGATVLIDGVEQGVTPLMLDGLSGTHSVQLRLKGYKAYSLSLHIKEGKRRDIGQVMEADQRDAGLQVSSSPHGAAVFIDGRRERGKTPLFVAGLDYGSHTVEIKLDGYAPYKEDHVVKQGVQTNVDATLKSLRGSLTLIGGPPHANVMLKWKGRANPFELDANGGLTTDLRGGTYTLTVTHKDYEPYTRSVTIGAKPVTHALKMVVGKGKLTVDSVPTDCEVFLDGARLGMTPLKGVIVPGGRHRLVIRHPDHSEFEKGVNIAVGEQLDLGKVTLLAACTIDLSELPSGVVALLNGVPVSNGDRIAPGMHKLKLQRPGYSTQELAIEATPGKSAVVEPAPWIRPQARLNVHPLPAGAHAFVDGKDVTGTTIVRYKPGRIELTITRPGYEAVKIRRTLVMGSTVSLPDDIEWTEIETRLDLSELPHGAVLMIDRKKYGHRAVVPPGDHTARLFLGNKRRGATFRLEIVSQETVRPVLPVLNAKPIKQALEWFKRHRDPSGNWSSTGFLRYCPANDRCTGPAVQTCDAGVSGLALLCFLRAGHTHNTGDYKDLVRRGLSALIKRQIRSGGLGMPSLPHYAWSHGFASFALIEAYRMTQDEELWIPAQKAVEFILRLRTVDLGWRYRVGGGESDTAMTSLMVQVLRAAEAAGLDIEENALDGAREWISRMTDPNDGRVGYLSRGGLPWRREGFDLAWPRDKSESMTAAGNVARLLLGARPTDMEVVNGAKLCLATLPRWWYSANPVDLENNRIMGNGLSHIDMYYWYYGSLFAYRIGGTHQRKWDKALRKALLKQQHTKGSPSGSWDPYGPHGAFGGRIYSTAVCCLALEWGYRFESLK